MACRTARPKRELVRIVRTPDGRIVLDESGRQPGRGAYVCRTASCLTIANTKGMTGRALTVWLQTSHPNMPNLIVAAEDRDDLIAYILSLRDKR